jgi:hypothetical protein
MREREGRLEREVEEARARHFCARLGARRELHKGARARRPEARGALRKPSYLHLDLVADQHAGEKEQALIGERPITSSGAARGWGNRLLGDRGRQAVARVGSGVCHLLLREGERLGALSGWRAPSAKKKRWTEMAALFPRGFFLGRSDTKCEIRRRRLRRTLGAQTCV